MPKKLTTEEFIEKAIKIHGDKYYYSKVKYIGSNKKIIIICKKHGEFKQRPTSHLSNEGCNICGKQQSIIKRRTSKEEFIKNVKRVHGDKYDYSKVNYINSNTKIIIICKKHGKFEQTPNSHLSYHGCPLCYYYNSFSTTQSFIEKAVKVHENRYDYSKVNYINNVTKVIIICKKHGEFLQRPNDHLQSSGCPKCGKFLSTELFIERSNKIHKNKYDYSKVDYKHNKIKVIIICKKHGIFKQTPNNHLYNGCPGCAKSAKLSTKKFIERSIKFHGNRYDYSKVNYINSVTKVIIICRKHGEFKQMPTDHLAGQFSNNKRGCGCPDCSGTKKLSTEQFIKNAKQVHGDRYDYSKVNYKNNKTKVTIICKKHGEFKQIPTDHLEGRFSNSRRGCGCPRCSASKGELKIEKWLKNKNINYIRQKRFSGCINKISLPFDFYLTDFNTCIEHDGIQHFKLVFFNNMIDINKAKENFENVKLHDKIKTDFCLNNNIKLLRIPYTKFNEIDKILEENIR
jgi:hypothetical protein